METFLSWRRAPAVDWYRWRWPALMLSAATILLGIGVAASKGGLPLGIDFTGGTVVTVKFAESVADDRVRAAIPGDPTVQQYGSPSDHAMMIRVGQRDESVEGRTLADEADAVAASLRSAGLPAFDIAGPRRSDRRLERTCAARASSPRCRPLPALPRTSRCDSGQASRPARLPRRSTTSSSRSVCSRLRLRLHA